MAGRLSHGMLMRALEYGYDKAVHGLPGFKTAEELADSYRRKDGTIADNAMSLVRWQLAKAGASGFLTGLGGLITLPVAIPVNVASVIYVQLRMVAAIAAMGGYNIRSDQVRTLVYLCMCGSAVTDILKDFGIKLGSKLAVSVIDKITGATLTKINQTVGFRLLTKFGQKGLVNLGKLVPFLGGIVGGTFDVATTRIVGKVAIKTFL